MWTPIKSSSRKRTCFSPPNTKSLSPYPKDPFVCPKKRDYIYNHILQMGFRPLDHQSYEFSGDFGILRASYIQLQKSCWGARPLRWMEMAWCSSWGWWQSNHIPCCVTSPTKTTKFSRDSHFPPKSCKGTIALQQTHISHLGKRGTSSSKMPC